MADFVFNIAKGKHAYYAGLPAANDGLKLILLKTSGLVADATLLDYTSLSGLLAGASDEADFTGYARRTLASVTVTPDNTNERLDVDAADPTGWTASGSAQAVSKAVVVYDPDTTSPVDANMIPLYAFDYVVTFDVGVPVTFSFDSVGLVRVT